MGRKRKQAAETNEISQIHTLSLGGISQKVLIEGKGADLPVVINLHGGPGTPLPFCVGCRGLFPVFTDNFIMVYWDQLGCGINDYKLKDKFTVDSFVGMTADLVAEVRKMFPASQVILLGMSWGSVLALKCLKKVGSDIDAVVIWGQVFRKLFLNEEVYGALEHAGLPAEKIRRIRAVTPENFTDKDMQFLAKNVRKYTDGYVNKKGKHTPMGPIIKGLLTSPDYRFKDFRAMVINGTATSTRLWPELLKMDLTEELLEVGMPYFILQGDTDIVTSTTELKREIESSHNTNLHFRIIENSGHIPGKEGMDAVLETLLHVKNSGGGQPYA